MDDGAGVTGVPEAMAAVRAELTPMMSQYADLCEAYDDCLVLFQVGDFYEAFCDAAATVARVCEVTLTKREDSTGTYPMAGVPIDNAAGYVESLLDAGYRVALADQVEDAEEASGLVDRAVTQVMTPGTVVDDSLLETGTATYVASIAASGAYDSARDGDPAADATFALASVDVSTGDCRVTSTDSWDLLVEEVERLGPAELIGAPEVSLSADDFDVDLAVSTYDADAFSREHATETLAAYVPNPDAVVENVAETRAVGGVLAYAEYTQGGDHLAYVSRVTRYDPREYLQLDATAQRSLELFETRAHRASGTLFETLDETSSALGRRRLEAWLHRPLVDRDAVETRHDAVAELADDSLTRAGIRDDLASVYDLERLVGRVSRERANARDLRSLATTLSVVPDLREHLADADCAALASLREELDPCTDVRDLITTAIVDDPPQELTEGGVIKTGFDADLDDLRSTEREGREWVADLEARERERTGIDSLEVGYNQVHGYYIEVTNPNLDRVPEDYQRRQTLKNSERFYTPELKRREDEILGAADRADSLEYDCFVSVRSDVADETERLQGLADALGRLDALATLAAVAAGNDYVRPELVDDGTVHLEAARHPVVERTQADFVPNDTDLARGEVAVITGPNMSGKSTYMRQVALCVVMAQMGSFVPARAARLPVVDRVFTRVGASDDIAGGQSTFMREMAELTDILHNATEDSLVLLDEVGRGTSTVDGLAIAWATTEFVHDEVGATTLFATHYHDLTALADRRERVTNLHFTAARDGEDVTFLHRVSEGPSSSSYGVEVATMAGVPEAVVERARTLVAEGVPVDDADDADGATPATDTADGGAAMRSSASLDDAKAPYTNGERGTGASQPSLDAYADGSAVASSTSGEAEGAERASSATDDSLAEVAAELREVDVADTTPLEALTLLNDLKTRLDGSEP